MIYTHAQGTLLLSALALLLSACPSPSEAPLPAPVDANMSSPDSAQDMPQAGADQGTADQDSAEMSSPDMGDQGLDQGADLGAVDTDADGLSDAQERMLGTDPTLPDTDADGIYDGDEVGFGLDPNNASSFNDGVSDGDRSTYSSCANALAQQASYHVSIPGDWTVALPVDASYHDVQLVTPEAQRELALYESADSTRQGLIYSMPKHVDDPSLFEAALGLRVALSVHFRILQDVTENRAKTHDGFEQVTLQGRLKPAPNTSSEELRRQLIEAVSGLTPSELSGLPAPQVTSASDEYDVQITLIERADRRILLAAVVPITDRDQDIFWRENTTDTTHLARANVMTQGLCTPQRLNLPQAPQIDFYMVLDHTGSITARYAALISFFDQLKEQLNTRRIDARFGVTNMDKTNQGRLRQSVGWVDNIDALNQEVGEYGFSCPSCTSQEEQGLYAAKEGITHMMSANAAPWEQLRPDAKLITLFISDEDDQSLKDGQYPGQAPSTRAALSQDYKSFFSQHTTSFALIAKDLACGEVGQGYEEVAAASAGMTISLCESGFSAPVTTLLDELGPITSRSIPLNGTPIAGTLVVYMEDPADPTQRIEVPRSRIDGFNYYAQANVIVFSGSFALMQTKSIAIHYMRFNP